MTNYDRRLLKRLQPSRSDSPPPTTDCQYRAFVYAGRRPVSCYYCTHCRGGCCRASWVSAGGGSPLLAPGPDTASTVDDGIMAARTPALYCSCGVVRAPENQPIDPDLDRKSDDDEVAPPGDGGDELTSSGGGTGLVMQNTIRLMLPEKRIQGRRQKHWKKLEQQPTRISRSFIDDSLLRPADINTPP